MIPLNGKSLKIWSLSVRPGDLITYCEGIRDVVFDPSPIGIILEETIVEALCTSEDPIHMYLIMWSNGKISDWLHNEDLEVIHEIG